MSNKPLKCSKCGAEFTLSMKDRLIRRLSTKQAQALSAVGPIADMAKEYCNACWKEAMNNAVIQVFKGLKTEITGHE